MHRPLWKNPGFPALGGGGAVIAGAGRREWEAALWVSLTVTLALCGPDIDSWGISIPLRRFAGRYWRVNGTDGSVATMPLSCVLLVTDIGKLMSNKTVTRAELTDALRKEVGLSYDECGKLLEDVLSHIIRCLVEEGELKLSNFGIFSVHQKKERVGRNPKTGEEAVISARRIVRFKPALNLKHQVTARAQ